MAHMPNEVVVHITQAELAGQLEALAEQYEEVVNTLRWQAENLRKGFDLTLDVRATQVQMGRPTPEMEHDDPRHADEQNPNAEELDGDVSDEEVKAALEPDVEWLMDPNARNE